MSKFGDKLFGVFSLNNSYDDDEFDDEFDDYEEENRPSRVKKKKVEDDDFYEEEKYVKSSKKGNKVVPMRTGRSGMEVCVVKPTTVEEAKEVTDVLLDGRAVILNLEGLHVDIAQRIVDFTSGSCYAVNGNFQKVSAYIFVLTPENVEISGDFQDLLTSGGFDVTSFNK